MEDQDLLPINNSTYKLLYSIPYTATLTIAWSISSSSGQPLCVAISLNILVICFSLTFKQISFTPVNTYYE